MIHCPTASDETVQAVLNRKETSSPSAIGGKGG